MVRRLIGVMALVCLTAAACLSFDDYMSRWTEVDRMSNPTGYTKFCRRQLEGTLRQLRIARPELQEQLRLLADEEQRILANRKFAATASVRFQDAFQAGESSGFPVNVQGDLWTQEAIESQTSSVMAQLKGYDSLLNRIRTGKQMAEAELQRLTVQESETESGLQLLAAFEKTLEARRDVPADTSEHLAKVQELIGRNESILAADAVGRAKSLLAESGSVQL